MGVPVGQEVAERDDLPIVADAVGKTRVQISEFRKCNTDNLKPALHGIRSISPAS